MHFIVYNQDDNAVAVTTSFAAAVAAQRLLEQRVLVPLGANFHAHRIEPDHYLYCTYRHDVPPPMTDAEIREFLEAPLRGLPFRHVVEDMQASDDARHDAAWRRWMTARP